MILGIGRSTLGPALIREAEILRKERNALYRGEQRIRLSSPRYAWIDTLFALPEAVGVPYREALAQFHLHPEDKFENGDYLDRGRTERRHVIATSIQRFSFAEDIAASVTACARAPSRKDGWQARRWTIASMNSNAWS
jgi:hypothetical protein